MPTEAEREYQRRWYQANKEKVKAHTRKHRENNPNAARGYAIKRRYGLTLDEYQEILEQHGNKCDTCSRIERLRIDHNHACCPTSERTCGKCIRGILCDWCNRALGMVRDNPETLRAMIAYLTQEEGR